MPPVSGLTGKDAGDATKAERRYLAAIQITSDGAKLARTRDISRELGVAPATVTGMLKKLSGKGLVRYHPYKGASLTAAGSRVAKAGRRREFILRRFFRLIGMGEEAAGIQAKEMGPSISEESYRRLVQLVCDLETRGERARVGLNRVAPEPNIP